MVRLKARHQVGSWPQLELQEDNSSKWHHNRHDSAYAAYFVFLGITCSNTWISKNLFMNACQQTHKIQKGRAAGPARLLGPC